MLKLVASPRNRAPVFEGDDGAAVRGALAGDESARRAIYERHADHVYRVLRRVLGFRHDLSDLHHEVFIRALISLPKLEDACALKAWLTRISVRVAHDAIKRRRRSWLWFLPPDEVPEVDAAAASEEVLDALHATYAVLDAFPPDERVAFALRFVDEMELTEIAAACGTSLATIKRRLARASERFEAGARRHPALVPWLEGGTRWRKPTSR